MSKNLYKIMRCFVIIFMITLTGCLKAREVASLTASSSAWFVGATSAKNLGGYPSAIKVSWSKADRATLGYNIYSLRTNSSGSNQWTLVGSVDADATSFTDSDSLTEGQIYSYKVLAIDALTGTEDGNTKQVSTVTFYGIAGVTITGKTTASISLNGSTGAFDSIKIYAQPKNGGTAATLVASANGNVENIDVTGLRSGVNYKFYARAYMSYLGSEDGNDSTILGQTYSDGFGSGKDNDSTFYYRGILNFQGYGTAPNATSGPKVRQFNITWLPFSNANSTTKYRVMRSTTTSIDTTVTTACTATSTSSCKVCEVTGTQYCEDAALASPPQIYYYAITLVKKDSAGVEYTEELPCQNSNDCNNKALYTVKAHVPSDYMVLVHRDAANYEMCLNINAASDPRHNQRCVYTGLGATPGTTGPTKPPRTYDAGYYDFGYNMLVDRYKVACNWTQNVNSCPTGMSSSGGGCIGVFTTGTGGLTGLYPTKNGGGRVMLGFSNNTANGDCLIDTVNVGGSTTNWYSVNMEATSLSLADIAKATTIDPGATGNKFRPPLHRMTPTGAARICNAQSSDYGSKRLLRRREYLVASPMPYISGEPNAVTTALSVFDAPNNATCNPTAALATGTTGDAAITAYLNSSNYQTAMDLNGTVLNSYSYGERFFIGNTATSSCVSRFGIQDPYTFFSPGIIFSDYFANSNAGTSPANATGTSGSDLDVSATDFVGYSFNGTMAPNRGFYGGTYGRYNWIQPTPTQTSYYGCNSSVNMTKFIPPLGVPVCTWTGGSQTFRTLSELTASGKLGTAHVGLAGNRSTARFPYLDQNMTGFVMTSSGEDTGRWSFSMADISGYNVSGVLCGVEAE